MQCYHERHGTDTRFEKVALHHVVSEKTSEVPNWDWWDLLSNYPLMNPHRWDHRHGRTIELKGITTVPFSRSCVLVCILLLYTSLAVSFPLCLLAWGSSMIWTHFTNWGGHVERWALSDPASAERPLTGWELGCEFSKSKKKEKKEKLSHYWLSQVFIALLYSLLLLHNFFFHNLFLLFYLLHWRF